MPSAWRRWSSEMQMLLHEHPGQRRARGGRPRAGDRRVAVGRRRRRMRRSRCRNGVSPRPARDGDVARGLARGTRATPRRHHRASRRCAAVDHARRAAGDHRRRALTALIARNGSQPAVAALERRALSSLDAGRRRRRGTRSPGTRAAPSWWQRCAHASRARVRGRLAATARMTIAIVRRPVAAAAQRWRTPGYRRCWRASTRRAASARRRSSTIRSPRCRRITSLRGIDEAAARLVRAIARARAHRDRRRLRRRRRDRLRGRRARTARDGRATSISSCPTASSTATG